MTRRHLNILLAVTFLVWIVPWQGKSLWPSVMGGPYIQWPATALTAILSSLGIFIGLRLLHSPQQGGIRTFWPSVAFLFIFVLNVIILGLAYLMQSRLLDSMSVAPYFEPQPEFYQTRDMIQGQLTQIPWLLATYLVSFTAVFFIGMALITRRKSANETLDGTA